MKSTTFIYSILFLALAGACSEAPTPPAVELSIVVEDEADTGLPGAQVTIGRHLIGTTGAGGTLIHSLRAPEGQPLRLRVACPKGTRGQGPTERTVRPRFLRQIDTTGGALAPLRLRFRCERRLRSHVVVVRTNLKESVPIQLLGETVGRTGANGIHQLVVEGPQGEDLEVRIDTSSYPQLRPASPARTFRIPAVSRLLVFDQIFEKKAEVVKRQPRRRQGPRRL